MPWFGWRSGSGRRWWRRSIWAYSGIAFVAESEAGTDETQDHDRLDQAGGDHGDRSRDRSRPRPCADTPREDRCPRRAVDRLRREGVNVLDFGTGEPDFPTPAAVNAAAHVAIDADFTKYTPVGGTAELKRATISRYEADYGVEYRENQVITSAGGKQAL